MADGVDEVDGGRRRAAVRVRPAVLADAEATRAIYNHEVVNHTTTLDMVPRTLDAQERWIEQRSGAFSAVVAVLDDTVRDDTVRGAAGDAAERASHGETVVGFAALSAYKERAAYAPTVENSVYVSRDHAGMGIGRALMEHLIETATASGFHSIIARIEATSEASLGLHRACGFEPVGIERQTGRKHHRWLDVAIMQRML